MQYRAITNIEDMTKEERYDIIKLRNEIVFRECFPGNQRGIHLTEKGLDIMEEYVKQVRDVVGMEIRLRPTTSARSASVPASSSRRDLKV